MFLQFYKLTIKRIKLAVFFVSTIRKYQKRKFSKLQKKKDRKKNRNSFCVAVDRNENLESCRK